MHQIKTCKIDGGNMEEEQSTESVWPQLPFQILIDIVKNLSNRDKFNAALTCKAWVPLLDIPALFTTGHFLFPLGDVKSALTFARARGKWLRHVYADCSELAYGNEDSSVIDAMYQLVASLLHSGNKKLERISFKDLTLLNKWYGGKRRTLADFLKIISTLIETQQNLKELDLTNAGLDADEGGHLLREVSRTCAKNLHRLAIDRFIKFDNLSNLTPFHSALYSFESLKELEISYDFLSNKFLNDLTKSSKSSLRLQVLKMRAIYTADAHRNTSPHVWRKLKASFPDLKESYYDELPLAILTPCMPLHGMHWNCGSIISIGNIIQGLKYVAAKFKNSLHCMDLTSEVRLGKEDIGEIFKSLQVCSRLETFALRLPCDLKTDERDYKLALSEVKTQHNATYVVTFNGQKV
ncbi:F-box only protein 39-like isoform X2 [Physella acuta]|uniref:F-box only protein 39-like isoform X2 n=1 Tax=Physella acuta TaxID=109671 RepID=UPI0027DE62C9|nr:F-box only protein 39-like isoform X2 [Physella acuta]